uniref:Uncharacterized protein n=1 Tax=Oryza sativa subsp. japonica TaxID=39947 RepID=Q5Z4X5_ORYSJ|nr:hypothetical protein [Oryza sativa Japonica Group]BAD62219.1 hypothetical protein [Oryza sativa Japonica Group]
MERVTGTSSGWGIGGAAPANWRRRGSARWGVRRGGEAGEQGWEEVGAICGGEYATGDRVRLRRA